MSDLVAVRFLRRDAPFEPGDERALPRAEAEKFVRQGAAELVVVQKQPAAKPAKRPDAGRE